MTLARFCSGMNTACAPASWYACFSFVGRSVCSIRPIADRSTDASAVNVCTTSAESSNAITVACPPFSMPSTKSVASRLASSSRVRPLTPSAAAMLAERSIRITLSLPAPGV